MVCLIANHLRDHRPGNHVILWKTVEVALKMGLHLSLRLGQKTQRNRAPEPAREKPQTKGPGVPEGIEKTCTAAEITKSILTPTKVIRLLSGRRLQQGL